jgi:enoyl-[acyl-carrier protein] reductase III
MNGGAEKQLTALVTGGSRGIGRAISLRLAESCAKTVIVNYLEKDAEAERVKSMIGERHSRCILAKANLLYPDEIDRLFDEVRANAETLDILVHCAALNAFKPLLEVKPNQWDMTMNINARGFLYCVQRAVPLMKKGHIVAISSLGGRRVFPDYGAMGPTKAALEASVRSLAAELAPRGIRVNAVTAGLVETDSLSKFPDAVKLAREAVRKTPAGRLGRPEDIADVVMFLLSPSAEWICGQTIVADGGISLY